MLCYVLIIYFMLRPDLEKKRLRKEVKENPKRKSETYKSLRLACTGRDSSRTSNIRYKSSKTRNPEAVRISAAVAT
jgi:hypothetical protein